MSSHGLSHMCIAVPQLEHSLSSDLSTYFNLPMNWITSLESLELNLSGVKIVRSVGFATAFAGGLARMLMHVKVFY